MLYARSSDGEADGMWIKAFWVQRGEKVNDERENRKKERVATILQENFEILERNAVTAMLSQLQRTTKDKPSPILQIFWLCYRRQILRNVRGSQGNSDTSLISISLQPRIVV